MSVEDKLVAVHRYLSPVSRVFHTVGAQAVLDVFEIVLTSAFGERAPDADASEHLSPASGIENVEFGSLETANVVACDLDKSLARGDVLGYAVDGEDVDEDALMELAVRLAGTYTRGALAAQLGMAADVVGIGVDRLQEEFGPEFVGQLDELVIVRAGHDDVDIVVPRDVAMMTNGS